MFEESKALVSRWIEARNTNNVEAAVALFSEDWHNRLRGAFNAITNAFPDVKITINEMIAEGNKVAVRWTFTGTHRGEFQGIPATGQAVNWTGIDIYTVTDGKLAGLERSGDMLGLLQQLGAISLPGR
jgi:steroid delta-isomerase-like uncharacterized protein